jgi:hypothetical protein
MSRYGKPGKLWKLYGRSPASAPEFRGCSYFVFCPCRPVEKFPSSPRFPTSRAAGTTKTSCHAIGPRREAASSGSTVATNDDRSSQRKTVQNRNTIRFCPTEHGKLTDVRTHPSLTQALPDEAKLFVHLEKTMNKTINATTLKKLSKQIALLGSPIDTECQNALIEIGIILTQYGKSIVETQALFLGFEQTTREWRAANNMQPRECREAVQEKKWLEQRQKESAEQLQNEAGDRFGPSLRSEQRKNRPNLSLVHSDVGPKQ